MPAQMSGFLLSHSRPQLCIGATSSDHAKDQAWWAGALKWGDKKGYRRATSAVDAPQFLVAVAKAFTKSALQTANVGQSCALKEGEEGLVHATLEQVAWASFKVHTALLTVIYRSM